VTFVTIKASKRILYQKLVTLAKSKGHAIFYLDSVEYFHLYRRRDEFPIHRAFVRPLNQDKAPGRNYAGALLIKYSDCEVLRSQDG